MRREDVELWLKGTILELQDGLAIEQIVSSASLFQDLGFDSLAFEKLAGIIESTVLKRDLTQWYYRVVRHGEDTVGSLLDFLLEGPQTSTAIGES